MTRTAANVIPDPWRSQESTGKLRLLGGPGTVLDRLLLEMLFPRVQEHRKTLNGPQQFEHWLR